MRVRWRTVGYAALTGISLFSPALCDEYPSLPAVGSKLDKSVADGTKNIGHPETSPQDESPSCSDIVKAATDSKKLTTLLNSWPKINVNCVNADGFSPLSIAALSCNWGNVDLLLTRVPPADVNQPLIEDQTTLNMVSGKKKPCPEVVDRLIHADGIDLNRPDKFGGTALSAVKVNIGLGQRSKDGEPGLDPAFGKNLPAYEAIALVLKRAGAK